MLTRGWFYLRHILVSQCWKNQREFLIYWYIFTITIALPVCMMLSRDLETCVGVWSPLTSISLFILLMYHWWLGAKVSKVKVKSSKCQHVQKLTLSFQIYIYLWNNLKLISTCICFCIKHVTKIVEILQREELTHSIITNFIPINATFDWFKTHTIASDQCDYFFTYSFILDT